MVITFRKHLVRDVGDQIFKWLLYIYKKIHTRASKRSHSLCCCCSYQLQLLQYQVADFAHSTCGNTAPANTNNQHSDNTHAVLNGLSY